MTRKTKRILKGAVAGLAGGLAGTLAMTEFQGWWSKTAKKQGSSSREEPATVKAARVIVEKTLHRRLPDKEKKLAGEIVHYAFGTLNGAVYGALAENSRVPGIARGVLFGAILFAVVDEGLVPLLGFSRGPTKYPLSSHLYALASHVVYGAATNTVSNMVRAAL
jgi:Protein of unknown function (DUF1440)